MSKKLISLVLVLAIAGIASAVDFAWNSDVAEGNWGDISNWKLGTVATSPAATSLPVLGDQTYTRPSLNGSISTGPITINVNVDAYSSRVNATYGTWTLNILDGVTLTNNGTIAATGCQIYNNTAAVVNVDGTWLNQRGDATAITVKIGGSGSGGSNTLNINDGGIVTVKQTALNNGVFAIGNTATGAGSARVNINAGGLLDVDSYTFGALVNKQMFIQAGGVMRIRGDVASQVNTDILAGYITGAKTTDVHVVSEAGGQLYTYVPEPATVALLGLGSLMLLRRKR